MISLTDNKISTVEYSALIFLTTGAKLADMSPTLLILQGSTSVWMVPLISACIISGPLFLLLYLVKKYELGLIELTFKLTGKWIGTLTGLALLVICVSSTAIDTRNYVETMSTMFFPQTPTVVLYIVFLGVSLFISSRGIENVARMSWIVLPYIKISLLILIILIFSKLNIAYLFPIWGEGVESIVWSGARNSSLFGEIFIMTVFFGSLRDKNKIQKASVLTFMIVIVEISIFLAIYITYFDIFSASRILYPFFQLTKAVQFGSFITSLEVFYFAIWVLAGFIRFAIYLLATSYIFSKILHVKKRKSMLLPFATLALLVGLIPDNIVESQLYGKGTLLIPYTSLLLLIIPLILGAFDLFRLKRG